MSWMQAICDSCWAQRNPRWLPTRLREPRPERCSYCGTDTESGIYVREDPSTVPYPREVPS